MFRRVVQISVLVVLAGTGPAHALKPKAHAAITETSCGAVGLPREFCRRAATENFNVDGREWDDLAAHAQIMEGATACDAAERAARYVRERATELRTALAAIAAGATREDDIGAAGIALGRLLHTVQDECAHHGMPNPQHAWFSLSDFCDDTDLSPDIQDDALACARRETDAVMAEVAGAVREAGVAAQLASGSCPVDPFHDRTEQQAAICDRRILPGPFDACDFLAEAKDWDGIDRQWNGDAVATALRDALAASMSGDTWAAPVCNGDEAALSPAVSAAIIDVTGGTPSCTRIHLLCLGKADDADNPFADEIESETTGCAVAGHDSVGGLLLVLLVVLRRRRVAP